MAGDWIKVQTCTPDKPEVHMIAEKLGIDPDAVTGKLIRIWCWADQQTIDGNARSVTKTLLDRVAGVTGFAEMLIEVGWLMPTDVGFAFPNFDRHNGNSAKTRASVAKRVEKHRKMPVANVDQCNASTVTSSLPEERREEKSKTTGGPPSEVLIPSKLNDPECLAAAEKWFDYLDSKGLKDKNPRWNEPQRQEWWMQMARLGREGFVEAVSQSIAAGLWNIRLDDRKLGSSNKRQSPEWIATIKAAHAFPEDWQKRKELLGDQLFEALKRTGSRQVATANDFELQNLKDIFESHLKDIRSGSKTSN